MSTPRGAGRPAAPPPRGLRTCIAALLTAATLGIALSPTPDAAAQQARTEPSARLTVSALEGVLGPGTAPVPEDPGEERVYAEDLELRALVENDGAVPLTAAQLVVEVHPPALTRGLLANALDGGLDGPALHVHTQPLRTDGALPPGAVAGLKEVFTPQEVPWAGDAGGVHPVRIAVTLGTRVLDEVVTAVVWLNDPVAAPLLTTFIWPVDAAPWRGPGGRYPDGVERETRPGARLDGLVRGLERGPSNVPVVLAPAAHLLEDLSDRSDGYTAQVRTDQGQLESRTISASSSSATDASDLLRRLRSVASDQVLAPVSGSYADADVPALQAGDDTLAELGAITASDGRRRVQLQLGTEVDGATHLVLDRIDEQVLDVLPGETLVLPATATDLPPIGSDPELGQPVRRVRAPSGRLLTALVGDPYLTPSLEALDSEAGGVVAAQRVVAETAMHYLTAPADADRGLVLLPPRTWAPPGAVAEELLLRLGDAGWLRFVGPTQLATEAQRDPRTIGLAPPEEGPFAPAITSELSRAWRALDAAVGASPPGSTRLGDRPVTQLREDLLRSASRWYRPPRDGEALALIRDVQRTVDETFGTVSLAAASVTLTSDTGEVPVTVTRDRGGPLLVTVQVESQGRLLWPEGRTSQVLELEEDGSTTVTFPTRAVSTGTFPVTVTITDPGGTQVLARDTLTVRSTALSGAALAGMAVLVIVLLLVGSLRRPERPRLAVVRDTEQPPA